MFKKIATTTLLCGYALAGSANASLVDLELQLLTDVSGSIWNMPHRNDYELQLGGYVAAFRNDDVINGILAGTNGSIAVQYIEWSSFNEQMVQLDWTLIDSRESSLAFADSIAAVTRQYVGHTAIGDAINFGVSQFVDNKFESNRQVIDISGDGVYNGGAIVSDARDAAFAAGIDTINAITIGDDKGLAQYYADNVVGGDNAFQLHATAFSTFEISIAQKLVREITATASDTVSVPEPTSIALLGLGLFGMLRLRRQA